MYITKEFRINEVRATSVYNAQYKIILVDDLIRQCKKEECSSLTLDTNACTRLTIPISLDLVGRTLVYSFECHKLRLKKGHIDDTALDADDLVIESVEKSETIVLSYEHIPPVKKDSILRTLELSTFHRGRGCIPCPFYHFFLDLTEKEYQVCKDLPPNTAFRASFYLKSE